MDTNGEPRWQVWGAAAAWALAGAVAGPQLALACALVGTPLAPWDAAGVCAALFALAGAALELDLW